MTTWQGHGRNAGHNSDLGLVLVGLGGPADLPPLACVADRLAAVLGRRLLTLQAEAGTTQALTTLHSQAGNGGGWLAALEVDAGRCLPEGDSWAEALGAWRQPTVLVIPAPQLDCGLAAAGTALLHQWRVPLLGLLQWEGPWQELDRRRDGLPWLGVLTQTGSSASLSQQQETQRLAMTLLRQERLLAHS